MGRACFLWVSVFFWFVLYSFFVGYLKREGGNCESFWYVFLQVGRVVFPYLLPLLIVIVLMGEIAGKTGRVFCLSFELALGMALGFGFFALAKGRD